MSIQPAATLPAAAAAASQQEARPSVHGSRPGEAPASEKLAGRAGETSRETVSREAVDRALKDIKEFVSVVAQNLQFTVDKETGKTIIKVTDASTKEVIRQIPSEEILAIAKALDRFRGLLIEQKA